MLKDRYPFYLANEPQTPNTDVEVGGLVIKHVPWFRVDAMPYGEALLRGSLGNQWP